MVGWMGFPSSYAPCLVCYRNQGQFTKKLSVHQASHFCNMPASNPEAWKQLSKRLLLLGFALLTAEQRIALLKLILLAQPVPLPKAHESHSAMDTSSYISS